MSGIIAKKLQMTQIVSGDDMVPVTLLRVPKQSVSQIKTADKDGYESVVISVLSDDGSKVVLKKEMPFSDEDKQKACEVKQSETNDAEQDSAEAEGEAESTEEAKPEAKESAPFGVGTDLHVGLLDGVSSVTLTSVSKGKGFTGAMKRWNFKGGPAAHGSKFHRALGSIGTRKPRRTKPGKKMHGRHGSAQTTCKKIPVELVDAENGIVAVRGPVPGARNTFVHIEF